jgi:hypothetical protein
VTLLGGYFSQILSATDQQRDKAGVTQPNIEKDEADDPAKRVWPTEKIYKAARLAKEGRLYFLFRFRQARRS